MRNIALSNIESFCFSIPGTVDTVFTGEEYILFYSGGKVIRYHTAEKSIIEICDLHDLYPVCNNVPKGLDITYSPEKRCVILIVSNGDVISAEIQDSSTCTSDIVGYIKGGLKAAKWNPQNEIVALVSGHHKVIVMTSRFDPVAEVSLHEEGFGEKEFTNVGWGKKETQFKGSEGKEKPEDDSAVQSAPSTTEETVIDDTITISWRGDGEFFAVSSINPEIGKRYLRIFSKEGVLQYTSEIVPGLEYPTDWKPSGNLIACTQKLPNKYNVCFFEKNGLKHGEFTLPLLYNEYTVNELHWNEDSRLLAILIEKIANITPITENSVVEILGEKTILIFSSSNYHWYSKFGIPIPLNNEVVFKWDKHIHNLLHLTISRKDQYMCYTKYTWSTTINKSRGTSLEDKSLVAVIDGPKLLITSFKSGIVPPPMCTYSLDLACQINQVGFAPKTPEDRTNDLFVLLCNGEIRIFRFECNKTKPYDMTHKLVGRLNPNAAFIYNVHWVAPNTFAFCEKVFDAHTKYLINVINILNYQPAVTFSVKKYPIKMSAAILTSCNNKTLVYHDNSGITYSLDIEKHVIVDLYPEQNIWMKEFEAIESKEKKLITLGLDKGNKFFINYRKIVSNVTSFHVHENFLLLTTLKHKLMCIPIKEDAEKMIVHIETNDISTRSVEKGSRLITSVPQDTKVILQMPRGNLECIQPRALSFSIIGNSLDKKNFHDAFSAMRQQRISLNLLYDHNPKLFRENVHEFIQQIKDPAWINVFLSELVDEDLTKTTYAVIYSTRDSDDEEEESKISIVCGLIERELENLENADEYILPILTSFMKRGEVYDIECALNRIKKLKDAEDNGKELTVKFDDAFRYMLYLIDVEELYKVALGMYDFDLVVLVATKSQKDPQEYLPFLNELRKMEVNYQKFTIDKYLKRYVKALKNLLQCGGDDYFTECLTFIKTHKLYRTAMKLVPHTTDRYKQICASYADELLKSNFFEEAGIMYSNSGSYSNAIAAFTKSGNWPEVINCARKLNFASQELYANIAGDLMDGNKFKEAADIFLDYLDNIEMALVALCSGKLFSEAFRLAELHDREDLIQSHIKPNILKSYQDVKTEMTTFVELFTSQRQRLAVVREKRLRYKEAGDLFNLYRVREHIFDSDSIIAPSHVGSCTTNSASKSARSRRKEERKLVSLKEGSPYEDLALITSLHKIISNCVEMSSEIREINRSLVKIDEVCMAEELQKTYEQILKEMENSTTEIWTSDLLSRRPMYGPGGTSNLLAASFMHGECYAPINLIHPRFLVPPEFQSNSKWQLEILNGRN